MSQRQRDFNLGDYVDVATRITEFREKYPDGRLRPLDPAQPYRIERIGDDTFIVYVAAAYRSADDPLPGVGTAQEAYPGKTPYTKGSELQNAETSAWGRAIVAALAADTKRGIASADEVRNRQAERDTDWENARPVDRPSVAQSALYDEYCRRIAAAEARETLPGIWEDAKADFSDGKLLHEHGDLLRAAIGDRDRELSGAPI